MDDFLQALKRHSANLFCEANLYGKRYVCASVTSHDDTWRLSCSDFSNFWSTELSFEAAVAKKQELDLDSATWNEFFGRLKEAFDVDNVYVAVDGDLTMSVQCMFDEGKQIPYNFLLPREHVRLQAFSK